MHPAIVFSQPLIIDYFALFSRSCRALLTKEMHLSRVVTQFGGKWQFLLLASIFLPLLHFILVLLNLSFLLSATIPEQHKKVFILYFRKLHSTVTTRARESKRQMLTDESCYLSAIFILLFKGQPIDQLGLMQILKHQRSNLDSS